MNKITVDREAVVIGVDMGDRWSQICALRATDGKKLEELKVRTKSEAFKDAFCGLGRTRIVIEVGTHSPWASRLLAAMGHEVIVANPRRVRLIAQGDRKSDRVDAEILARLGRIDPGLLSPIQHRGEAVQKDLALLRMRDGLVRARTLLIQQARGLAKSFGERLPESSTPGFAKRVREAGQAELFPGMPVLLETLDQLTDSIRQLEREIGVLGSQRYPETQQLRQVHGVGAITSLAYVLTVEDPKRFAKSREVGAYFGLCPKQRDSGEARPALGISKRGDDYVRQLLVQSAHYILGPFGVDCDLRRVGLRLVERGGRQARKRAVVAVARKLAVLLHRLWITGEAYEPLGYGRAEAVAA